MWHASLTWTDQLAPSSTIRIPFPPLVPGFHALLEQLELFLVCHQSNLHYILVRYPPGRRCDQSLYYLTLVKKIS